MPVSLELYCGLPLPYCVIKLVLWRYCVSLSVFFLLQSSGLACLGCHVSRVNKQLLSGDALEGGGAVGSGWVQDEGVYWAVGVVGIEIGRHVSSAYKKLLSGDAIEGDEVVGLGYGLRDIPYFALIISSN
ncbi:hypothetical protein DM860_007388 [Cuscuta australis]|uniref:Uncharacterized protein n=1 Tax=Cuscuta australis TaxID=267555 RepID=A0A328E532_9ASTE|nr:hypothetical protein DM860_007388 [Cuscuta australis]